MTAWTTTDFTTEANESMVPVLPVVDEFYPFAALNRIEKTTLQWYPRATLGRMTRVRHHPMQEEPKVPAPTIISHLMAY